MNVTLLKALIALVPSSMLLFGSAVLFSRRRAVSTFLQLLGAGALVFVVLVHISEGTSLFPWMNWGLEDSVGHYLDLGGAILALTSFPLGYLLCAFAR
jgi:hypothetical protein